MISEYSNSRDLLEKALVAIASRYNIEIDELKEHDFIKELFLDEEQKSKGVSIIISDDVTLASFILTLFDIPEHESDSVYDLNDSDDCTKLNQQENVGYTIDEEFKNSNEYQSDHSMQILWQLLKDILHKNGKILLAIENYYVDKIYRNSYYSYYSGKHFSYSRFCKRLFIFNGNLSNDCEFSDISIRELEENFIGSMVIRPLFGRRIGRSLLNPFYLYNSDEAYLRYAKYSITMFGRRLEVKAFPYSMQDLETISCAETTILNLVDYFSKKYQDYRNILPSEIDEIALKHGYQRHYPTKGLNYTLIPKILMECGFYPVMYTTCKLQDKMKIKRIMHYYIESGIPIIVSGKLDMYNYHSIICIGHGKVTDIQQYKREYSIVHSQNSNRINFWIIDSSDLVDEYIVMDDQRRPYCQDKWQDEKALLGQIEVECLMVPLYQKMYLEALDAYDICTTILANPDLGIRSVGNIIDNLEFQVSSLGSIHNPIAIRLFMASTRGFKKARVKNFGSNNKEVRERYINTPFPRFVWVCELYLPEDYNNNKCIGEIIIDATANNNMKLNSVILIQYPYLMFQQFPNQLYDKTNFVFEKLTEWEKFDGYRGNLYDR